MQHSQGTRTLHIFDASCADEDPNRKPIRTACEIVEVEFVAERGIMPNLTCNFASDPLSSSQTIFSQREGDAGRTPHVLSAVSPIRGAYTVRTVSVMKRNPLVLDLQFCSFCGDMMIRDHYLVDAKMTILVNPLNNMHRMIILSGSNDACVSMERKL